MEKVQNEVNMVSVNSVHKQTCTNQADLRGRTLNSRQLKHIDIWCSFTVCRLCSMNGNYW